MLYFFGALMRRKQMYDEFKSFFCVWQKDRLHICLIMQYNGNEIYATRYMKSLFLFGRRGDRIFSIVPDRCQILLYEKHGLCFVTTVFEICPAYVYCIWNGFTLHLEHKLNILAERKFAVPSKITFRITAEHGVNFIEFCDAVVECRF